MKKMLVFVLSALMIFGLAACGSQDSGNRTSVPQPANEGSGTGTDQNLSGQQEESKGSSAETPVEESGGSSAKDVEPTEGKILVVYYSATGYTESVAGYIAEATGGELFELEPVEEYSSDDLDWTDRNSRVSLEYANPDERAMELVASSVPDWESYDTIFIGYAGGIIGLN